MTPSRTLSGMERLWLVADRLHGPFVNQMVIEGDGYPKPRESWDEILQQVAEAQPTACARLHGRFAWSRWRADGPLPEVRELDAPDWDGRGPAGAPFLEARLFPRHGPTSEILLLRGAPTRVVIRTHHAMTDGQGALLLARAVFAALRAEPVPRAVMGPQNDHALARTLGVPRERIVPRGSSAPMGLADGTEFRTTWGRRRVEGRFSKILPRLAVALLEWNGVPAGRSFSVAVPADLRPHAPGLVSTANLTGLLRIPLHDYLGRADAVEGVDRAIRGGLSRREAGGVVLTSEFGRYVPLGLMTRLARRDARRSLVEDKFGCTAVLSNLGRLDPAAFSGAGFTARRCFFVPPGNPGLPLFLTLTGDLEGVELCATVPRPLASGGRLAELLDRLEDALVT